MYTLLISQVVLYMIVPGSNGKANPAIARMSFDDFFLEQVLNIPDQTPGDETDDAERVMQIVRVERFHRHNEVPDPITFHIITSPYRPGSECKTASIAYDILVPPPLS